MELMDAWQARGRQDEAVQLGTKCLRHRYLDKGRLPHQNSLASLSAHAMLRCPPKTCTQVAPPHLG